MAPAAPTTPSRAVGTPAKNAAAAATASAAAPSTYSTEEALKDTLMGVLRFFMVAVGRASLNPHHRTASHCLPIVNRGHHCCLRHPRPDTASPVQLNRPPPRPPSCASRASCGCVRENTGRRLSFTQMLKYSSDR
jgi:hypothetical protein